MYKYELRNKNYNDVTCKQTTVAGVMISNDYLSKMTPGVVFEGIHLKSIHRAQLYTTF